MECKFDGRLFKKWSFSSGSTISEGGAIANDVPIEVE